jgi:hypothetical protein
MNLKDAIETFRTELRKFTTQKQSFADYKLVDGTVVRVDGDLVAGTPVYVIADDTTLPAPDGEHTVEGVGVVKTEGGKITEVVVAEAPAPAEEVAVAAEITPEVAGEVVSEIAEGYPMVDPLMVEEIVKKHLVSIMEELKAAYTEMGKMKDKMAAFCKPNGNHDRHRGEGRRTTVRSPQANRIRNRGATEGLCPAELQRPRRSNPITQKS